MHFLCFTVLPIRHLKKREGLWVKLAFTKNSGIVTGDTLFS